jgi:hypothetical protein
MTHICRICLNDIDDNELIKPCNCTQGFFHKECLKKWIMEKKSEKCEVCLTRYKNIKIVDKFDTKENLVCITLNTYTFITNLFFWIFFFSIKLSNKYLLILPPCYSLGCISILVVFIKCKLIKYKKKIYFDP